MINSSDITVIVQGAVVNEKNKKWTHDVCKSIRKFLPKSEIILSTWEGSNCEGVDYDRLVLNKDPGMLESHYEGYDKPAVINNFNRQIVSTRNGIKCAERKYVMKLRSDSVLTNTNFLRFYEKECLLEKRIATLEPRNPYGNFYGQFCLCDFWFFGEREALLKLWDIPLYQNKIISDRDILGEEYLMLCQMKDNTGYGITELLSKKHEELFRYYEQIIKRDFLIIPTRKSGIVCQKYPTINDFVLVCIKHNVLSFSNWMVLAKGSETPLKYRIYSASQDFLGKVVLRIKKTKLKKVYHFIRR